MSQEPLLFSLCACVSQEPLLFSGKLRFCMDPTGDFSDAAMEDALDAVGVLPYFRANAPAGTSALEFVVAEQGDNLSVGQRQLLCLARALLRRPKVLLMDEASASVDGDTDVFINNVIRERFNCTLIIIAHRLQTIMECDRVLVLDDGCVIEHDTPLALLSDGNR